MKAISLWQPWASLVVEGFKQYETRSWATNYRGLLAVHATKTYPSEAREIMVDLIDDYEIVSQRFQGATLPTGAVLGIVRLVSCHPMYPEFIARQVDMEEAMGDWREGRHAWRLEVVERFAEPIPAKGAQGFWNWEDPRVATPQDLFKVAGASGLLKETQGAG